jgi:hypothetical protein
MSVFQEFCSYIIGDELRNDPGYWLLDAGSRFRLRKTVAVAQLVSVCGYRLRVESETNMRESNNSTVLRKTKLAAQPNNE